LSFFEKKINARLQNVKQNQNILFKPERKHMTVNPTIIPSSGDE